MERTRSKTSPESFEEEKETDIVVAQTEVKKEELKSVEKPVEQFRKFDPSSPAKPTPKHLQRHMRNESMRFPSGDFSNVTITPRKSVTAEITDIKVSEKQETSVVQEFISQKEIVSAQVEEKLDDGELSPDLVGEDEKDIAEAPLKDKINSFESKMSKEGSIELPKTTVKLTREALKKHTMEQEQGIEYTQKFVREQNKISSEVESLVAQKKTSFETEEQINEIKTVKETIQQFDLKEKTDEKKIKTHTPAMRTDSTLVQVSSEEESEFLKKSTDSETETESQTTVKVEKDQKKVKPDLKGKPDFAGKDTKTKGKDSIDKSSGDEKKDDQGVSIKEEKTETEERKMTVSEKIKQVMNDLNLPKMY